MSAHDKPFDPDLIKSLQALSDRVRVLERADHKHEWGHRKTDIGSRLYYERFCLDMECNGTETFRMGALPEGWPEHMQ